MVAALAALLVAPAASAQQTGGTDPGAPDPNATGGTLAESAGPLTLAVKPGAMYGRVVHFRGFADPSFVGRALRIERYDATTGWAVVARARVRPSTRFLARWRTDHIGHFWVRAVISGRRSAGAAAQAVTWPMAQVTVYRPVVATWYGPGFYGRRTACGRRLTPDTLGIAHPKLRCGTLVDVMYQGRSVTVPVVDHGPYANHASFDLTAAAAAALGIRSTARIGAVSVRARRSAPPPP
ncbi:MAG: rare lipoprotein [Solirubrobacteraceae bacterium]|jgi:rare lipoprotein A (peptidoglycan hydrolase)|nr:rare lipoprotein [Solirubrobacteraceae bacterium]